LTVVADTQGILLTEIGVVVNSAEPQFAKEAVNSSALRSQSQRSMGTRK